MYKRQVSSSTTQGSYSDGDGRWTVGSLVNGATAAMTLTAQVDPGTAGATVTNTVIASADQVDPDLSTNSASVPITVGPTFSMSDVAVAEGDGGTTGAVFTVTLSAGPVYTATVDYATADGSAVAPGDYTAVPITTLTFAPSVTTRAISVSVQGDTLDESNETFYVTLSNPSGAAITDNQGVGTIIDDDATLQTFLAAEDSWIDENNNTANNGTDTSLRIDPSSGTELRTLIKFDVTTIPTSSTVLSATLSVYVDGAQAGQVIEIYRVITDWIESGVTWDERIAGTSWSSAGGDYDATTVFGSFNPDTVGTRALGLTALVQAWVGGTYDNYGVVLTATGSTGTASLASREAISVTQRPRLSVEYNELGGFSLPDSRGRLYLPVVMRWPPAQVDPQSTTVPGPTPSVPQQPAHSKHRVYLPMVRR